MGVGWVGVPFPAEKRYVTLEWPLSIIFSVFQYYIQCILVLYSVYLLLGELACKCACCI